jgi:hypothetical protein
MSLTITREQRDALYDQIFDRLSGIGDVWLAASMASYETATRLGREYSDDLRLVLDDLGWGDGSSGTVELTTPPDVLRRTLIRLRDAAVSCDSAQQEERARVRAEEERNRLVVEACQQVLTDLDEAPAPDAQMRAEAPGRCGT